MATSDQWLRARINVGVYSLYRIADKKIVLRKCNKRRRSWAKATTQPLIHRRVNLLFANKIWSMLSPLGWDRYGAESSCSTKRSQVVNCLHLEFHPSARPLLVCYSVSYFYPVPLSSFACVFCACVLCICILSSKWRTKRYPSIPSIHSDLLSP